MLQLERGEILDKFEILFPVLPKNILPYIRLMISQSGSEIECKHYLYYVVSCPSTLRDYYISIYLSKPIL